MLKTIAEFNRDKSKPSGLSNLCKDCNKVVSRRWYQENRERAAETGAKRYRADLEKSKRQRREWREANIERKRQADRAYYLATRERQLEYKRRYAAENSAAAVERAKAWKRRNPDAVADIGRRRRARTRTVDARPVNKQQVWERCGGMCGICGEAIDRSLKWPDPMSLTLDHIIPLARGGPHTPENVQTAHAHCNRLKGARLDSEAS